MAASERSPAATERNDDADGKQHGRVDPSASPTPTLDAIEHALLPGLHAYKATRPGGGLQETRMSIVGCVLQRRAAASVPISCSSLATAAAPKMVFGLFSDGSINWVSFNNGLCIGVSGGSTAPGAQLGAFTCDNGPNQHRFGQ